MKTIARNLGLVAMLSLAFMAVPALAQDSMPGMDMPQTHSHTTSPAKTTTQKHASSTKAKQAQPPAGHPMSHMNMQDMQMQGGKVPPGARSADYSDGIGYSAMPGIDMMDDAPLGMLLLDRLEYFNGRNDNGVALDAQGWYGTDANKLWIKAEGERSAGRLQALRTEALWAHPVSTYWNTQLGVRQDFGVGPGRTWAAFGVQGLAPWFFDVDATFYVGQAGRTAFRFEATYEMRFTQRLVLQPRLEMNMYGKDDRQRGIGAGLSDVEFGLRLRYEFTRKFAPYVGVAAERTFGITADIARHTGDAAFDARIVAGLHVWF